MNRTIKMEGDNTMKKEKSEVKDMLRLPIIVVILFITALFILFYIDKKITDSKRQEIINNEQRLIELNIDLISNDVTNIMNDLHFLEGTYNFYLNNKIKFNDIEETWKLFAENSRKYDQIRFLDKDGNETIRINYSNEKSYIVPKKDLQNKKDRYYFYETIKLNKNQHYISKLDLNIEHNKIEEPIKPMIRFSTKVYYKDEFIGIIVLNYLAENILKDFKKISLNSMGEIYLLNSSGYWIAGGKNDENWAFMYDEKKKISFKNKFPLEWKTMNDGEKIFSSQNGYYIWNELKTKDGYHENNEGTIVLGDGNFRVVSSIDNKNKNLYIFSENIFEKIYRIIRVNWFLFILIGLIAVMIEILAVVLKKAYLRMRYIADHDGLTKVYTRRAGMERLENLLSKENRRKNHELSICFVDVNGLKQVNDVLGHEKGDELILTVANTMKKILREDDLIIRFGGDEFLIVFLEANHLIAENIWNRIVAVFEEINLTEDRKYLLSVSHGIIESKTSNETIMDEIIKTADAKMYEEKKRIKSEGFNVLK